MSLKELAGYGEIMIQCHDAPDADTIRYEDVYIIRRDIFEKTYEQMK